jgi:hypothetical protein
MFEIYSETQGAFWEDLGVKVMVPGAMNHFNKITRDIPEPEVANKLRMDIRKNLNIIGGFSRSTTIKV